MLRSGKAYRLSNSVQQCHAFDQSLALIADAASIFLDDWMLIGSAAAKLAGANVGPINDIDLLLSTRDNHALKTHWRSRSILPAPPSEQFRSAIFHRFSAPLPIETMSDFALRTGDGNWQQISPQTRVKYGNMFAPNINEQIAILQLMGRPKDARRIAALKNLISK